MDVNDLEKSLAQAFVLGQRYSEYADSERISDHRRADETMEIYRQLVWRVCNRFMQETNQ